uniref:Uncharacterized protein n=1 Tax=Zea mays TaxID=4577 RepID=A0A804REH2_MAIZE
MMAEWPCNNGGVAACWVRKMGRESANEEWGGGAGRLGSSLEAQTRCVGWGHGVQATVYPCGTHDVVVATVERVVFAVRIAASFGSKPHGLLHVATPLQLSRYLRDCSKSLPDLKHQLNGHNGESTRNSAGHL